MIYLARSATSSRSHIMPQSEHLPMEDLRARIRAAGVVIADNRLAMVQKLLGDALAPLHRLDTQTIKTVEPAVTFAPLQEVQP
jgi:hypothetical protein